MSCVGLINPYVFSTFAMLPSDLANLVRWYKSDTFSLSDGATVGEVGVSPWVDQSASAADLTQGTGGARPVYKTNIFGTSPAVRFDGIDDFLNMTLLTLAGELTIIGVGTFTTDGMLFGNTGANMQIRILRGGLNVISFFAGVGEFASSTFGVAASSLGTKLWLRDGTNSVEFRENKTDRTLVPGMDTGSLQINCMGQGNGGSFITGDIAEVCVYSQRHTNANLDLLYDGYWKIKYPSLP